MAIIVHVHKKSADSRPENEHIRKDKISALAGAARVSEKTAEKYLESNGWDNGKAMMALQTDKRAGKVSDHRLDLVTPATDSERRERIQEVVRNVGCTSAVATRWLEAEEWIVDTTVRELKHAMRLGFTVDATRDAAGKANAAQVNNGLSLAGEIQQLLERKGESMNANDMTNALMALAGVARVLRSA